MVELHEMSAEGPCLVLGGRTVQLRGPLLRHRAAMEAQVIAARGNKLDLLRDGKALFKEDPRLLPLFVKEAFEQARRWNIVTLRELGEWMDSFDGIAFVLWKLVEHNGPETFTLDFVRNSIESGLEGNPDYLDQVRDRINTVMNPDSGNSKAPLPE